MARLPQYDSPILEIIEFVSEQGFAVSQTEIDPYLLYELPAE